MPENETCAAERIISELIKDGWKNSRDGMTYLNGTLGTNLYKDGEVISISQEFYPDEELIEDLWPEEYNEA